MLPRNRKPTVESVESREKFIVRKKQEIEELKEIKKIRDTDYWALRQKRLEQKLEAVESQIDSFQTMADRDILLYLAERLMLRNELRSFLEIDDRIIEIHQEIIELEKGINERRERLGIPTA